MAKEKITKRKTPSAEATALVNAVTHGMGEVKAHDIVVMDLRQLGHAMADYFVVCHGNSSTQVQAIAQFVERETFNLCQEKPLHVEGTQNAKWILMDYINVVVHIFDREARDFYSLEDLWADAKTKRIKE